jgi:hypothetical protein
MRNKEAGTRRRHRGSVGLFSSWQVHRRQLVLATGADQAGQRPFSGFGGIKLGTAVSQLVAVDRGQ